MKQLKLFMLMMVFVAVGSYADRSDKAIKQLERGQVARALKTLNSEDKKGKDKAAYFLGRIYEMGFGVKIDVGKAAKFYKKAADRGNTRAMNRYGIMRMNGHGIVQNYADGADYVCRAADKKDLSGIFNCAMIYYKGTGREENTAKALELFEQAGAKAHIGALNNLGFHYLGDKKRKPDYKKSYEYFTRAAFLGSKLAMFQLGNTLSLDGTGIKDYVEAHKYFNLASALGDKSAEQKRDELGKKMSSDQIREAQKRADSWDKTWIMVRTAHADDRVYIDGKLVGSSGKTKYRVSPGKHTVVIKKDGYQDKTVTVEVKAGEGVRLPAKGSYTLKKP